MVSAPRMAGSRELIAAPVSVALIGPDQVIQQSEGYMASQTEIPPPVLGLPSCPQCDTRMLLIRILPVSPGYQRRTYECPRCQHEVTEVIPLR
jgi:hypothetical protein